MIYDKDGNAVRNEDGTPVGSVDVNELTEEQKVQMGIVAADEATPAESEDLSKLHKDELVARAQERGYDTEGLLKADLVALLETSPDEAS